MEQKLSLFQAAVALMKNKDITEDDIVVDDRYSMNLITNTNGKKVFSFDVYDEEIYEVFNMDEEEYYAFAPSSMLLEDRLRNDDENNIDHDEPIKELPEDWIKETYKDRLVLLIDKLPSATFNKIEHIRTLMFNDNKPLADFAYDYMYENGDNWALGGLFSKMMETYYDRFVDFSTSFYEDLMRMQIDTWVENMRHKGVNISEYGPGMFSFTITPQRMILLSHRCRDCDLIDIFDTSGVHKIQKPSESVWYMEGVDLDQWTNSVDFEWVIKDVDRYVDDFYDEIGDDPELKETHKKLHPFNLKPLTANPTPFKMGDGKEYLYHGYNVDGQYNIISDKNGKYKVPTERLINLILNTRLDLYK